MDSLIAEGRSADWLQNETYLKPYLPYDPLLNGIDFLL